MMQIRPVSDLRNKFTEIESVVKEGHGSMVVMSLEKFSQLTDDIETKLDEADAYALSNSTRYTHEEVFETLKGKLNYEQHL